MSNLLITGGTGSLGQSFLDRIIKDTEALPDVGRIVIFSRDEAKQWFLRNRLQNFKDREICYRIGDVRCYDSVRRVIRDFGIDVVVNAAALKQVPSCESHPDEATKTNVIGSVNIINASKDLGVRKVLGISTDKACKPINAMGISKALMEKVILSGGTESMTTMCVRYGNVLASRGSVVPYFYEQIKRGEAPTVTDSRMTRFLLTLDQAVDTLLFALDICKNGEICVPKCLSNTVVEVAETMCEYLNPKLHWVEVGIRPGEKIHEILLHEEEVIRGIEYGSYYVIGPHMQRMIYTLDNEYSSDDLAFRRNRENLIKMLSDGGFLE